LPEGKVKIRRGGVERSVREKGRTSDGWGQVDEGA